MSDPDPNPREEQVRRLLAAARHDDPMPADVAARLDGVLAELRDEFRRTSAPVDLAARRRRRLARNVLVAAAAVVVLGVGVSRIDLSGQDADGGSADSGAASAPQDSARDDAGGDSLMTPGRPPVLTPDDFDAQVGLLGSESLNLYDDDALPSRAWCDDAAWGSGQRIAVRYDGDRGVLVLRAPTGASRVADLYLCGETVPTRSTTVPAG